MYDVHLASQDRARGDPDSHDVSDAYETESESESLDTAASVVSCDDSDMTLVDSETESEVSPGGGSSSSEDNDVGTLRDQHIIKKHLVLTHDSSYSGLSSLMTPGRTPPVRALSDTSLVLSCPPHQRRSRPLRSAYCSRPLTPPIATAASGSGKMLARRSSWATDWYRRWECMIEVSHRRQMVEGKRKFFLNYEPEDDLDRFEAISLL